MTEDVTLDILRVGEALCVSALLGNEDMRERLRDLGITPNTKVRCVMISPLGDPKAYEVRGAVIALRREDACGVVGTRLLPSGVLYG